MNLNKVYLAGNLTRDPELRCTKSGMSICELGLAVNRKSGNSDGQQKNEVCFVEVTVWGKVGEACGKHLQKGSHIFLEGHLSFEQWTDAGGNNRSRLKVTADTVQFLGAEGGDDKGGGRPASNSPQKAAPQKKSQPSDYPDDVPPF